MEVKEMILPHWVYTLYKPDPNIKIWMGNNWYCEVPNAKVEEQHIQGTIYVKSIYRAIFREYDFNIATYLSSAVYVFRMHFFIENLIL